MSNAKKMLMGAPAGGINIEILNTASIATASGGYATADVSSWGIEYGDMLTVTPVNSMAYQMVSYQDLILHDGSFVNFTNTNGIYDEIFVNYYDAGYAATVSCWNYLVNSTDGKPSSSIQIRTGLGNTYTAGIVLHTRGATTCTHQGGDIGVRANLSSKTYSVPNATGLVNGSLVVSYIAYANASNDNFASTSSNADSTVRRNYGGTYDLDSYMQLKTANTATFQFGDVTTQGDEYADAYVASTIVFS